jgi:hypothetical protein
MVDVEARFEALAWTYSQHRDKPESTAAHHDGGMISKTAIARERDRRMRHVSIRIGEDLRGLPQTVGYHATKAAESADSRHGRLARRLGSDNIGSKRASAWAAHRQEPFRRPQGNESS